MKNETRRVVLWSVLAIMLITSGTLYAGSSGRAMTTLQHNNQRTGWNTDEPYLTLDTVNRDTFGKMWTSDTLSGPIYGTPLYVSGVEINGTTYDVVYVATGNNLIYALNAATGQAVWPDGPYFLGTPGNGRGSISPVGITSTPVIDREAGILYAVGLTVEKGMEVFKVAAVDISNGQSIDGWPVPILPPTTPMVDTRNTGNRGALLLANGMVYVPFGGYAGDFGPYHGWVVGVSTTSPSAPQVYFRTPGNQTNHRGSGIWASGGIAADDKGYIYAVTGNSFGAPSLDYSNAVVKLPPDLAFSEEAADFFVPSNWRALNDRDADLGSSAPLLIPPQKGSNTPNMLFVMGKAGAGHLLDRDNLGGVGQGDGINGEGVYSIRAFNSAFSTAAYYEDDEVGPVIFLAGRGNAVTCNRSGVAALRLSTDSEGNSTYHTLWCTPSIGNTTSPVITSNGKGPTGIMWTVSFGGILYAFNAATGEQLYNSTMVVGDALGGGVRNFGHLTVIDSLVLIPTNGNRVVAYGLR